jgi:hypothetical protein
VRVKIIIAISLLALSATAQAQIVKCVGKDGKIEFASSCPPGTKQQDTGVPNKPAPAAAPAKDEKGDKGDKGGKGTVKGADKSAPKSLAERDAESRKNQKEKAEADAKAQKSLVDDMRRQQACNDARGNLKRLQDRQRMTRTDPKTGERVYFEEQDFIKETANAERSISENCK